VEIIIPEYIRVFPNGKPGKRISQGKMQCREQEGSQRFSIATSDTVGIQPGICGRFKPQMPRATQIKCPEWRSALLQ